MTTLLCRITRCGLKNAPASMKIRESGDGRFKKSSAAQCYPVKNNRAQAPVTTLTAATSVGNFTFLLYLNKLMFMSLNVNFYCQHWKFGLYHSYIRKHGADCCRINLGIAFDFLEEKQSLIIIFAFAEQYISLMT